MSRATATRLIRERSSELGIDGIGICDADPLDEVRTSITAAVRSGLIPPEEAPGRRALERLTTPSLHLRGVRSIVSAYEAYPTDEASGVREASGVDGTAEAGPRHGIIAPYTRANYYKDLRLRLQDLAAFMKDELGARTKPFSCYVTLAEKPLARKAGLGFYGKNGVIITERHGSCVVLGEILTDLELERDRPLDLDCGTCRICMDACPTGAIAEPHRLDRRRCIQFLSGRRRVVPLDIRELWQDRLYGCSTCQDVCPFNKRRETVSRDVAIGRVGDSVPLEDMLTIDDLEFAKRFGDNQIGRREVPILRRNAALAAAHTRERGFIPLLKRMSRDPDPMIRQHSLWAIWRIDGAASEALLRSALDVETEPEIAEELKTLLDGRGWVS